MKTPVIWAVVHKKDGYVMNQHFPTRLEARWNVICYRKQLGEKFKVVKYVVEAK